MSEIPQVHVGGCNAGCDGDGHMLLGEGQQYATVESITALRVTRAELEGALTEWERRYREEPRRFESDFERVLAGRTPESYGEGAAAYLIELLVELCPTSG